MAKTSAIAFSILISAACARSTKHGGDVEPELGDAVAIVALEQAGDERAGDFADTQAPAAPARDCNFGALSASVVARYDANANGALDARELAALRGDFGGRTARGQLRQVARLERIKLLRWIYDQNADRKLDAREWNALRDDLNARCENDAQQPPRQTGSPEQAARVLREFDANHDGRLDAREQSAAWNAASQRIESHWETLIDRFDTDRNGMLSARERAALREYERSVIRGERSIPLPDERGDAGARRDASTDQ